MVNALAWALKARLRSSTLMATCEASQWVDETTPNVPRISGRVVKDGFIVIPGGQGMMRAV